MQVGLTVKGEICELMDTLLDLQQQYTDPKPPSDPTAPVLPHRVQPLLPLLLSSYGATLSKADQSLLRLLLHINDIIFNSDAYKRQLLLSRPPSKTAGTAVGSNASDSVTNNATAMEGQETAAANDDVGEEPAGPIGARLHGPLAQAG